MPGCGWWCCCGEDDCGIGSDDFDRASIGAGWAVQSGTWAISSNLLTTSSASAYIRFETAHPVAEAAHYVYVKIRVDGSYLTPGDKARIVLSDTMYAELEMGLIPDDCDSAASTVNDPGVGCFRLRLLEGSTVLAVSPFFRPRIFDSAYVVMVAGYRSDTPVIWASVATNPFQPPWDEGPYGSWCVVSTSVSSPPTGTKVGLGTGGTVNGTIAFDDFNYEKHNSATVSDCWEPCTEDSWPTGCLLSEGIFAVPKNSIASSDLGCAFTIASGTWNAVDSGSGTTNWADYLQTSSSDALIECDLDGFTTNGYMTLYAQLAIETDGDKAYLYIDYDATSGNGHYVELTCGDATGDGGNIALYKNGSKLEERSTVAIKPGTAFTVAICTSDPDDGSGMDKVSVAINGIPGVSSPAPTVQMIAATTVNGNEQYSFGTGSSQSGWVRVYIGGLACHGPHLYDNYDDCADCESSDCAVCPADDGPNEGFSFAVSGLASAYSEPCDCTDLNATYAVDYTPGSRCTGSSSWTWCTVPGFGGGTYTTHVSWAVTASGGGWKLSMSIWVTNPSGSNLGGATYSKTFAMTDLCTSLSSESLTFESYIGSPSACTNWNILTVTATHY